MSADRKKSKTLNHKGHEGEIAKIAEIAKIEKQASPLINADLHTFWSVQIGVICDEVLGFCEEPSRPKNLHQ